MEFYPDRSSGFDIPLWAMNLILLIVFSVLLVLLILIARKKAINKNQKEASENEI
jgi:hypothetical protein